MRPATRPAPAPWLQRLALSFLIFFLLLRLSNMRLWRGPQALDADVGAPALPAPSAVLACCHIALARC